MVASVSADRFAPVDVPRVSASQDGTLAAIHEPSRITLLELPTGTAFAEIGVDPDALASEVAWVGTPPRLLVLSRYDGNSTAHMIDPLGPRTIAEIRLEATMRLSATVGGWALAIGALGTAVMSSSETSLAAYQFPARVIPVTAGAAAGQFLVALAGSVEEWDPQSRTPKRRMRLPRSAAITGVGGSERLVWMTTQQEPARIDVIPLVNRGQPRAHDLPEPILRTLGHPRSDVVVCLGAESGRLYVVDLDGRTRMRILEPDGIERIDAASLVMGRMTGILAAQAGHPIAIVGLDGRDIDPDAGSSGTMILPRALVRRPIADERDVADHGRSGLVPAGSALHEEAPAAAPSSLVDEPVDARGDERADAPVDSHGDSHDDSHDDSHGDSRDDSRGDSDAPEAIVQPSPAIGVSHPAELHAATDDATDAPPDEAVSDRPASASLSSIAARIAGRSSSVEPAIAGPQPGVPAVRATPPSPAPARQPQPPPSSAKPPPSVSERFSAWRDMVRQNQGHSSPGIAVPAPSPPAPSPPAAGPRVLPGPVLAPPAVARAPVREEPRPGPRDEPRLTWRDDVALWSHAVVASGGDPAVHAQPIAYAIEALLARFELDAAMLPVVALLYGAHLRGEMGVAPIEVARMLERQWDEALGRGELARTGVCEYARSRVALSPVILRALDELPPLTGMMLGPPGPVALLGPCVVIASGEPLVDVAERYLPRVGGAILLGHPDVPWAPLVFEARAYGAAAMLRVDRPVSTSSSDPVIFVVDDSELADRLAVPHLA
ncbi:MAG TPA: hypothetical protein VLM79_36590 [Kofleriaceae bacterium]|nr:hypothetical protein [Kofleriaceae bacterium]